MCHRYGERREGGVCHGTYTIIILRTTPRSKGNVPMSNTVCVCVCAIVIVYVMHVEEVCVHVCVEVCLHSVGVYVCLHSVHVCVCICECKWCGHVCVCVYVKCIHVHV